MEKANLLQRTSTHHSKPYSKQHKIFALEHFYKATQNPSYDRT